MDEPLTQVSTDEQDRGTLELEVETAWALQKHHEQRADAIARELKMELRYRNRLQIKARAFDQIARKIFEVAAGFHEWGEIEAMVDALLAMEQTVKDANHKLDVLIKSQEGKPG